MINPFRWLKLNCLSTTVIRIAIYFKSRYSSANNLIVLFIVYYDFLQFITIQFISNNYF